MQVNRKSQMRVVKNDHMRVVQKNWEYEKRIAFLENVLLELHLKNENSVLYEFAKIMGVTPRQILEQNKSDNMCDIRHLYCYLRCKKHQISFSEIGREINRSHTAVSKGVERIQKLFDIKYKPIDVLWCKVKDVTEKKKYIVIYEPH